MADSKVQIMNLALRKLGAETIMNPTQNVKRAKAINDIYDVMLDDELAKHPWNFAVNRATLAVLATPPAWGYDYAFQLPVAPYCLRVLELLEHRDEGYEYRIEGRTLVTDSDSARIKYIKRVTDPQQHSAWFDQVFSARLAAEAAFDITNSRAKEDQMWTLYVAKLEEAQEHDAWEGMGTTDDEVVDDDGSWVSER